MALQPEEYVEVEQQPVVEPISYDQYKSFF